jgi:chorismate-pyruvate lyase
VNPLDELTRLTSQFSRGGALIEHAEHIPASITPEPYKQMLVHEHHMTVTMEQYHGCPVNVQICDSSLAGNVYSRKIILTRSDDATPVQFGIVRFNFDYVTAAVKDQILSGQIPLGRVLILHNVLRHIDLGAILKITAGPELSELLHMPERGTTYGRLATIFCNRAPAVDLLEITAPLTAR